MKTLSPKERQKFVQKMLELDGNFDIPPMPIRNRLPMPSVEVHTPRKRVSIWAKIWRVLR